MSRTLGGRPPLGRRGRDDDRGVRPLERAKRRFVRADEGHVRAEAHRPRPAEGADQCALALIGPEHAQPVEDRDRVGERDQHRHRPHTRPGELVVERDRKLSHASEAECPCDRQQFDVEGVALHQQQRYDLVGDLAAEDLQSDLRVANVEPEKDPHKLLEEPRRDTTRARVAHLRIGMPLGADGEVEPVALCDCYELGDRRGIEVKVGVAVGHPPAL